jgi:GDP-D-mannose dehydratase
MLISISKIKNVKVEQDSKYTRPTGVPRLIGDTSKFRKLTGWKPEISVDKMLEDILEYWRDFVKNNDY